MLCMGMQYTRLRLPMIILRQQPTEMHPRSEPGNEKIAEQLEIDIEAVRQIAQHA
jgi:hypothetical protein